MVYSKSLSVSIKSPAAATIDMKVLGNIYDWWKSFTSPKSWMTVFSYYLELVPFAENLEGRGGCSHCLLKQYYLTEADISIGSTGSPATGGASPHLKIKNNGQYQSVDDAYRKFNTTTVLEFHGADTAAGVDVSIRGEVMDEERNQSMLTGVESIQVHITQPVEHSVLTKHVGYNLLHSSLTRTRTIAIHQAVAPPKVCDTGHTPTRQPGAAPGTPTSTRGGFGAPVAPKQFMGPDNAERRFYFVFSTR
ncbi:hypothetical protein Btru_004286 [Bulinus truncatus]|nr:hypothetical protein Btru_004286 [Bulinus truncatus]